MNIINEEFYRSLTHELAVWIFDYFHIESSLTVRHTCDCIACIPGRKSEGEALWIIINAMSSGVRRAGSQAGHINVYIRYHPDARERDPRELYVASLRHTNLVRISCFALSLFYLCLLFITLSLSHSCGFSITRTLFSAIQKQSTLVPRLILTAT